MLSMSRSKRVLETTYVDEDGRTVNDCRFTVGPAVGREWVDDGRREVHCDRGPSYDGLDVEGEDSLEPPILPDTTNLRAEEKAIVVKQFYDTYDMVAWRMIIKSKTPFSENEVAEIEADVEAADLGIKIMNTIRERLCADLWPEKGLIEPENYEVVMAGLGGMKTELISTVVKSEEEKKIFERFWPFDCWRNVLF
ncbi:hypothetical protein AJ80_01785 [Polytolypa hystricis UAMH7299]|uniref:Uncharacterized protein n=1 Tax=Polytolypa hystricis (strain UAMH7299) TaxID=1447883 RepID=A0A2B7Z073_POLH7|nr:hypothetical protein AJ80_01785 [Polytolypa hystricis UAMH7299]